MKAENNCITDFADQEIVKRMLLFRFWYVLSDGKSWLIRNAENNFNIHISVKSLKHIFILHWTDWLLSVIRKVSVRELWPCHEPKEPEGLLKPVKLPLSTNWWSIIIFNLRNAIENGAYYSLHKSYLNISAFSGIMKVKTFHISKWI